jgi:hypothetical protein
VSDEPAVSLLLVLPLAGFLATGFVGPRLGRIAMTRGYLLSAGR